jgi:hypothetical protein
MVLALSYFFIMFCFLGGGNLGVFVAISDFIRGTDCDIGVAISYFY